MKVLRTIVWLIIAFGFGCIFGGSWVLKQVGFFESNQPRRFSYNVPPRRRTA